MSGNETILEVRNLKKYFFSGKKRRGREPRAVKALDGVSFPWSTGNLGVVGSRAAASPPWQDHTAPS